MMNNDELHLVSKKNQVLDLILLLAPLMEFLSGFPSHHGGVLKILLVMLVSFIVAESINLG